jgi:hypothetical protein
MDQTSLSGILVLVMLLGIAGEPAVTPVQTTVSPSSVETSPAPATPPQVRPVEQGKPCDAQAWRYLVGRSLSDLLTVKLPPGTRVYRIDDPVGKAIPANTLTVQISRNTRVRRVYCS